MCYRPFSCNISAIKVSLINSSSALCLSSSPNWLYTANCLRISYEVVITDFITGVAMNKTGFVCLSHMGIDSSLFKTCSVKS